MEKGACALWILMGKVPQRQPRRTVRQKEMWDANKLEEAMGQESWDKKVVSLATWVLPSVGATRRLSAVRLLWTDS